jgi:CHRD domain
MRTGRLLAAGVLAVTAMLTLPAAHAATTNERADMTGAQETSPPGPADAKGTATITLDDAANTVCYQLTYSGISKPTAAHIHAGAKGVAGPPVVTFDVQKTGDKGCVPSDAATIGKIRDNPDAYYVNIHTAEYPKGAMRGQLAKA